MERKQRELARMTALRSSCCKNTQRYRASAGTKALRRARPARRGCRKKTFKKLHDDFNIKKSKRLEAINQRGNKEASKNMITEAKEDIIELEATAAKYETEAAAAEEKIKDLRSQLTTPLPFEQTEEHRSVTAQIDAYRTEEQEAGKTTSAEVTTITGEIHALFANAEAQKDLKAKLRIAEGQKERIEELKRSEKTLAERYEKLGTWRLPLRAFHQDQGQHADR